MKNDKLDPDELVLVPRFAANIAADLIVKHEAEQGELLGVTGRVWRELREGADNEGLTPENLGDVLGALQSHVQAQPGSGDEHYWAALAEQFEARKKHR